MTCGLVLEGGAMRGLFTAGVLDLFMERGVAFDGAVGVSAGACFGCNLKSRQPGRVLRYNLRFAKDPRYCSWRSLLRTGDLFNADFCYRALPLELDPFDSAAYEANPMPFHVVATDCATGKPVYRRLDRVTPETLAWIRASASMPLVSRPVPVGGGEYLDGGLSDSVPLDWFEREGYARNVVILTRPRGYRKAPLSRRAALLLRLLLRRRPAVFEALRRRADVYNAALDHLARREADGAALVIAPDAPLTIPRLCHDPAQMRQAYDQGRQAAEAALPALRRFLAAP